MKLALSLVSLFVALSGPVWAQSEAVVEQVGAGQMATLTQMSTQQMARVNRVALRQVNGDGAGGNVALLTQSGGALAEIEQAGTLNRLLGLDGISAALSLDGSTLYLAQTGANNTALVEQAGGAYASITQNGSGNLVTISQQ